MKRFSQFSPAAVRLALHMAAILILLTGFTTAYIIWPANESDNDGERLANPAMPLAPSDSGKQSRQIEIYYGKIGVLAERWSEDIRPLFHGKPLAKAIALSSAFLTLTCVFVASRVRE